MQQKKHFKNIENITIEWKCTRRRKNEEKKSIEYVYGILCAHCACNQSNESNVLQLLLSK